jgi:hypothetical protein
MTAGSILAQNIGSVNESGSHLGIMFIDKTNDLREIVRRERRKSPFRKKLLGILGILPIDNCAHVCYTKDRDEQTAASKGANHEQATTISHSETGSGWALRLASRDAGRCTA